MHNFDPVAHGKREILVVRITSNISLAECRCDTRPWTCYPSVSRCIVLAEHSAIKKEITDLVRGYVEGFTDRIAINDCYPDKRTPALSSFDTGGIATADGRSCRVARGSGNCDSPKPTRVLRIKWLEPSPLLFRWVRVQSADISPKASWRLDSHHLCVELTPKMNGVESAL
jgi:hypothetical protein